MNSLSNPKKKQAMVSLKKIVLKRNKTMKVRIKMKMKEQKRLAILLIF
jgi:hypothetical protein